MENRPYIVTFELQNQVNRNYRIYVKDRSSYDEFKKKIAERALMLRIEYFRIDYTINDREYNILDEEDFKQFVEENVEDVLVRKEMESPISSTQPIQSNQPHQPTQRIQGAIWYCCRLLGLIGIFAFCWFSCDGLVGFMDCFNRTVRFILFIFAIFSILSGQVKKIIGKIVFEFFRPLFLGNK